jgi:rubrerythrin
LGEWKGGIMFTMREIIEFAIRIEENGEKVYRDASAKVSDFTK